MKIKVIPIKQGSTTFYSGILNSSELSKIATVLPRSKDSKNGVQRLLNSARVKGIARFINEEKKVIFPNSIILNLPKEAIFKDGFISLKEIEGSAQIIDGQHRYEGVIESGKNIPLIVTFFIGLPVIEQAKIFLKINSTQKGINTNLVYDLFHLTKTAETDSAIAIDLVYRLNEDPESPWYELIKTSDSRAKKEAINSSSLITPLKKIIQNKHGVYSTLDYEEQYLSLRNYFNAIKKTFPNQWNSKSYVLTKGVGVNAFLRLFPRLLIKSIKSQDTLCANIADLLKPLKKYDFTSKDYSGFSSESGYDKLAQILEAELEL